MTQDRMSKWNGDRLDDYVLLPAANGYVSRTECFFVSHFWQTRDHPDPDGKYLRLLQNELRPQHWSYVWVDWSCIPQNPRSESEKIFFLQSLQSMSGIIRNCGFIWFYPPFEPRLWILYEIAEFSLTCDGDLPPMEDIRIFADHVKEMLQVGVRSTLDKHGYRCTYDRDREFLTSWLEVLVLLRKLHIDTDDIRRFADMLTWAPSARVMKMATINGLVEFSRYEGTLICRGERHTFTPFPRWVSCLPP